MSDQRLFISHANEDAAIAERIVTYLEARGVPCWISSRDIPPRAIYADAITEALRACSACAVVLSRASNQSKAVKRELELTSHYDKPFIPIRIDATEPAPGVDYYLRNTQWLDYRRDGERALDRIVAQVQGAPLPPPPSRPRHGPQPMMIGGVALVIALLGAGVWFAWTQFASPPGATQTADVSAEALAPLLGSYNWEGVECGRGPTITLENQALVFTMPDTPTYRHDVLSATAANDDGYALRVETRVAAPAEAAGQNYSLVLNGDTLMVMTSTREDAWTRCEVAPVVEQATAVRTPSVAGTTWRFHDGGLVAFRANGTFVDSACNYGVWRQAGSEVTVDRNDGWRATGRLVNNRLVEFGYVGSDQGTIAASPADHNALSCSP